MGFSELIQTFGWPIGSAVFAVICLYFDIVVSGKRYREVRRERDQLLRIVLGATRVGERSTSVADRALSVLAHSQSETDARDEPDEMGR